MNIETIGWLLITAGVLYIVGFLAWVFWFYLAIEVFLFLVAIFAVGMGVGMIDKDDA